jgi:tRNA (guanine37-N1)-methyltransferase
VKVSVFSLFPNSLAGILDASILGRARAAGLIAVDIVDLRSFATDKHKTVDDRPCGGGAGMVLRVDVVAAALATVPNAHKVLVDARARPFTQSAARRLAQRAHVAILCGRYEGVDARAEVYVDEVVSLGDFVLTGGELPALVMIDAMARLVPGVLGNDESSERESHGDDGLLEHRHYTKPVEYDGRVVPPVLLGGNHRDIDGARRKDALVVTAERRPDLFIAARLTKRDDELLDDDSVSALAPVSAPIRAQLTP